jgi:hypothetical protein
MRPMTRAIAIAAIHIALICSLGLKLLHDRQTCPQAWFKTRQYDPNLPIRGRYLSLQVEVRDPLGSEETASKFRDEIQRNEKLQTQSHWRGPIDFGRECGSIALEAGAPVAKFEAKANGNPLGLCDNLTFSRQRAADRATTALVVQEPVIFFIPDTAHVPWHWRDGSELWVLATVPRKGPPRAIALGLKKAGENRIERLKLD